MFSRAVSAVVRALIASGKTPFGKAVEHAAVAAASLGLTVLIGAAIKKHGLSFSDVSGAAAVAGTAFFAGVRALIKANIKGVPASA